MYQDGRGFGDKERTIKLEAGPVSSSHIPSATFFSSQKNHMAAPSTEKCPPGQQLREGPLPPVTLKLKGQPPAGPLPWQC